MFLLSHSNTSGNLGELEEAVETLTCWLMFPQQISFSQTSPLVSINIRELDYELEISILR